MRQQRSPWNVWVILQRWVTQITRVKNLLHHKLKITKGVPFCPQHWPNLCLIICVFFEGLLSFWSESSCQYWELVLWWVLWYVFSFSINWESLTMDGLWEFSREQKCACSQGLTRCGTWEPDLFFFWLKTCCLFHLNLNKNYCDWDRVIIQRQKWGRVLQVWSVAWIVAWVKCRGNWADLWKIGTCMSENACEKLW